MRILGTSETTFIGARPHGEAYSLRWSPGHVWFYGRRFGFPPPSPSGTLLLVTKHRCDKKCKGSQNIIDRFARMGLTIIPRGTHDAIIRGRVWPGRNQFINDALPALRAHWQEVVANLKTAPALT
jgi:hypothetical protein